MNEFREKLLHLVETPRTRKELVELMDAPRTTIYDNLYALIKKGLVVKFSKSGGRRGRPTVYFCRRNEK